jgi:hypothetical protein
MRHQREWQMTHVRLAWNWSKARVLKSLDKGQKQELIRFLRERYQERFLTPIRCLRNAPENEHGFGFAMMSLCCLLVETLGCYRSGLPSSHWGERMEECFHSYLQELAVANWTSDLWRNARRKIWWLAQVS